MDYMLLEHTLINTVHIEKRVGCSDNLNRISSLATWLFIVKGNVLIRHHNQPFSITEAQLVHIAENEQWNIKFESEAILFIITYNRVVVSDQPFLKMLQQQSKLYKAISFLPIYKKSTLFEQTEQLYQYYQVKKSLAVNSSFYLHSAEDSSFDK